MKQRTHHYETTFVLYVHVQTVQYSTMQLNQFVVFYACFPNAFYAKTREEELFRIVVVVVYVGGRAENLLERGQKKVLSKQAGALILVK